MNDTSGNLNVTIASSWIPFTILRANTSVNLWLNGTAGPVSYNKSEAIEQGAQSNVTGLTVTIYNDFSGDNTTANSSTTTVNVTNSSTSLARGTYRVSAKVSGNANYSETVNTTHVVTIVDNIVPTISAASISVAGLYKYQNITINATITDNDFIDWPNNFAWVRIGFANKSYININLTLTNYTSTDWSANFNVSNYTLGVNNVTIYANDTSGKVNSSAVLTFNLWGVSNLSNIVVASTMSSFPAPLSCRVLDKNTTDTIQNYPVNFYQNQSLLTTNYTNSTGWAVYYYTQSTPAVYNITCGIVYNSTLYYNVSEYANLSVETTVSDATPPIVFMYEYTNGTARQNNTNININVSVSDGTGSGIPAGAVCNVTIGGVSFGNISVSGEWCNKTITVYSATEGNKTINVTINDAASNTGFNDSYVVTMDFTKPTLTIDKPVLNTYIKLAGAYIWINGTVSDNIRMGTGNISTNDTRFVVNSSYPWMKFSGVNDTVFNITNISAITDGYVAINVSYLDAASNNGSAVIGFYSDNIAPNGTGLTTGYILSGNQSIRVRVLDNLMTNTTMTLNYWRNLVDDANNDGVTDTGEWQSTTMNINSSSSLGTSTDYFAYIYIHSSNTQVKYYVTGTDNATNTISASSNSASSPLATINIGTAADTTAPNNPSSITAVQVSGTKQINLTWTASASSDATGYYVYRDTGVVSTSSTNLGEAGNTTKFTDTVPADGTWNYTIVAHDAVPNVNTTIVTSANITIDTTAPSVTNSNTAPVKNSNGKISDNTPTIVVNISETGACRFDTVDVAMSSMTYEMSGSGTQNHNYTITTALNDSTYTYYIRCNDTIGNVMIISSTISFILDTTGNFNYTQSLVGTSSGRWNTLWLPSQSVMEAMSYSSATTNAWNISYVLSTNGGLGTNYNIVYYYNGSAWASFRLGSWTASSLQYMNNTNDKPYWINMTTTDRFEI
jgi:hypothetical protein